MQNTKSERDRVFRPNLEDNREIADRATCTKSDFDCGQSVKDFLNVNEIDEAILFVQ